MAATQFLLPFRPAFDSNGLIVAGAELYFYASGTSTPQPVYADETLLIELANPVTANAAGVWPIIYLDTSLSYRAVLKDEDGNTLNDADPYFPLEAEREAAEATASAAAANTSANSAASYAVAADASADIAVAAQAAAEYAETNAALSEAAAEAAADLAQSYGAMAPYKTWTALSGVTGSAGDFALVISTDTGTHTDPVATGTADNAGIYAWSASPAGWERVDELPALLAMAWAEGTEPGGVSTKSAKEWATEAQTASEGASRILDGYDQTLLTGTETTGNTIQDGTTVGANMLRFLNDPFAKTGIVQTVNIWNKTSGGTPVIRFYSKNANGTYTYEDEVALGAAVVGSQAIDVSGQNVTVREGWYAAHLAPTVNGRIAAVNELAERSADLATSGEIATILDYQKPSFSVEVDWQESVDQGAVKDGIDSVPQPARNGVYGLTRANTARIRAAINNVRKGTGSAKMLVFGDSITVGSGSGTGTLNYTNARDRNYTAQMKDKVAGYLPDGLLLPVEYESILGQNNVQGTYPDYNSRVSSVGGWAIENSPNFSTLGGNVWRSTASGIAPLVFTPVANIDTFEVRCYKRAGFGVIRYRVDGGSWVTIDCNAASDEYHVETVSVALGAHTIEIDHGSGGNVYLAGVMAYNSLRPCVRITPCGASGSRTTSWIDVNTNPWSPGVLMWREPADLKIIALGTNDIDDGLNIATAINRIRGIVPKMVLSSDVVLMTQPPQVVDAGNSTQARQDEWRQSIIALGQELKVPVVDTYAWMGDYATANARGLMAEGLHPSYAGAGVMADALVELFRRIA